MSEENGNEQNIFNDELFAQILGSKGQLLSWQPFKLENSVGILSNICKDDCIPVGHFGFHINYTPHGVGEKQETLSVVIKSKVPGTTTENTLNGLAQLCGPPLPEAYQKHKKIAGFGKTGIREVKMFSIRDSRLTSIIPEVYHVHHDPSKNVFLVAMEFLGPHNVTHFNAVDDAPDVWTKEDIQIALKGIAGFHTIYLNNVEDLEKEPWMEYFTAEKMETMSEVWHGFLENSRHHMPHLWTENRYRIVKQIIANIRHIWSVIEKSPRTLIHNDFNPRNACLRISTKELVIYDLELATLHVPQYDVAEFLTFALSPDTDPSVRLDYVEYYRQELVKLSPDIALDKDKCEELFNVSCCEIAFHRLGYYGQVPGVPQGKYLPRTVEGALRYLEYLDAEGKIDFGQ